MVALDGHPSSCGNAPLAGFWLAVAPPLWPVLAHRDAASRRWLWAV